MMVRHKSDIYLKILIQQSLLVKRRKRIESFREKYGDENLHMSVKVGKQKKVGKIAV
jgi:hypothetical protein